MSVIPPDYPIEKLLPLCEKCRVSKIEVKGNGVTIEFYAPTGRLDATEAVPQSDYLNYKPDPIRPPGSLTLDQLSASAPEHPADAVLTAPNFDIPAPEFPGDESEETK